MTILQYADEEGNDFNPHDENNRPFCPYKSVFSSENRLIYCQPDLVDICFHNNVLEWETVSSIKKIKSLIWSFFLGLNPSTCVGPQWKGQQCPGAAL